MEEKLKQEEALKQLKDVVETLTEREQTVLNLRYGLDGGRRRTLEEVSRELDMTRERTRQIEAKALRKIRHQIGKGTERSLRIL